MDKRYLLIIDSLILLGSLISVFLLVGYTQPLVTAPLPENSNEPSLLFTFSTTDYLILDDNFQFDSPHTFFASDESFVLKPGKYYIKSFNGLSDEVREINTEVELVLKLRNLEDGSLGVFNVGTSDLSVETYKIGSLVNNTLVYAEDE